MGSQLPLRYLLAHYHAILLAYGVSKDRELGLTGEKEGQNIYSARDFVGWYNGLPECRDLNPDLSAGENAVIVGMGNVALDVARTLLTSVDVLRKTDMPEHVLETLSQSRIRHVRVVGRRGPVQAAYTIKELREMMRLPHTLFEPVPRQLFPERVDVLERPTRRLVELLMNESARHSIQGAANTASSWNGKAWSLNFLLSPYSLSFNPHDSKQLNGVTFTRTKLERADARDSPLRLPSVTDNPEFVHMDASTLFRSVGYKSEALQTNDADPVRIPFNEAKGIIPHDFEGRILTQPRHAAASATTDGEAKAGVEAETAPAAAEAPRQALTLNPAPARAQIQTPASAPAPALYCAGWVKTGPTGTIATTMRDAFHVAETIVQDWSSGSSSSRSSGSSSSSSGTERHGWPAVVAQAEQEGVNIRRVNWYDWKKIDRVEKERCFQGVDVGQRATSTTTTEKEKENEEKEKEKEKQIKPKPREKLVTVEEMLNVLDC